MIDNPGTVARLLEQMEDQLPLPAFPTKHVVRILRRGGVKASVDRALSITRVFYAGDEGGICCDVTPRGVNEVFIRLADAPAACATSSTVPCRRGVPA